VIDESVDDEDGEERDEVDGGVELLVLLQDGQGNEDSRVVATGVAHVFDCARYNSSSSV
jgi:hypothetical protein